MQPLPEDFIHNIEHSHKEGKAWLQALPSLLADAAQRWGLTLGKPFLLSFNYVCAARDETTGLELVLKAGVPNPELTSEIEALRLYDGRGAVRLIDSDAGKGLLLLERLQPGTMLVEVDDDARATEIAAGVMRSLWRPAPQPNNLILLQNWFDAFWQYRQRFGVTGPLPLVLLQTAEGLVADFFAEREPQVVLHGDFHHYNLLKSGDGWKVIDPKGVIGPRGYEVGPLLVNPFGGLLRGPDAKQISERRMTILAAQLGMERSRIRGWAIAHAALSACWSFNEHGRGAEHALHCAEVFMRIR